MRLRDLLLLGSFAAALFLPWLGARDLWNPNEPLYGRAVAEMAAAGDWLVPQVNGQLFGEKPILYFWLARVAAGFGGGVDELTLRLPSAVAGIAAVLLTYLLVVPYAGRRRARLAGLLCATTFLVFWTARQVQMDLLLTVCALASVVGATRAIDGLWRAGIGWTVAGASAGLGFLAKGPVGVIVPGLVVATYAVGTARGRELLRPSVAAGVAACVAVAAPWYLTLWAAGHRAFVSELLVRQNLLRFVEPWDHAAPWWYYLRYFWLDLAPWAWLVPLAWGLQPTDRTQERDERRLERLAWGWILVVIVFFSLSASKRSPYILPIAPAVAVLAAAVVDRTRVRGWRARVGRIVLALLGVVLLGAGIALAAALVLDVGAQWVDQAPELARAAKTMAAVFLSCGLLALGGVAAARRHAGLAPAAAVIALAVVYLAAAAGALPAANAVKSHRALCEAIVAEVGPDDPLRGFHEWRWRASYSYYSGRSIPNLDSTEALAEYWGRDEQVFLLVEEGRLELARQVLGPVEPRVTREVGNNRAHLFSNAD